MYDILFSYIQQFNSKPISVEDKEQYRLAFAPFRLRKKQFFLQEGNRCTSFAFVIKGAMRQFSVDDKGVEHIARLGIENWWMGDRESFVMGTPSVYNIDAWENTEMLLLSRQNALELSTNQCFGQMLHRLDEKNNMANQRRIIGAISGSAAKRFADFEASYPELMTRFPQHIIASYLGLTKDTLSRIRSRRAKQ